MSISQDELLKSYLVGRAVAEQNFEKQAFIAPLGNALKFLFMGGHLGKAGSIASKISPHHIGMPLGFGAFSAATAEEGERGSAFTKGLAGGLAFNAFTPIGRLLGSRIAAPGFTTRSSGKILGRMGFSDDAVANIGASQNINKLLHGGTSRRLASGNLSAKQQSQLLSKIKGIELKNVDPNLKNQLDNLRGSLKAGINPADQKQFLEQMKKFTKALRTESAATGPAGAQKMLKGVGISKMIGGGLGGLGLGIYGDHTVQGMFDTPPASVFSNRETH